MENPQGVLTPAYGRDYRSLKSVQVDFDAGKDFRLNSPYGSTLCSIRDFAGKGMIQVRYAKLRRVGFLSYDR